MLIGLSMLVVVIGLLMLPKAALAGLLVMAGGAWIFSKASGRSEDVFVGLLMIGGGAGAAAIFVQYLLQRLNSL
jgi:hypothetical protein